MPLPTLVSRCCGTESCLPAQMKEYEVSFVEAVRRSDDAERSMSEIEERLDLAIRVRLVPLKRDRHW
jgi:hypothetical protein